MSILVVSQCRKNDKKQCSAVIASREAAWQSMYFLYLFRSKLKKSITGNALLEKLKTLFDQWVMALQATLLPESPFWAASFVNREFSHAMMALCLSIKPP